MFCRKVNAFEGVSILGFGCMRFPTAADGKIDYTAAEALIDEAYQQGVNYFDTAYFYHGGDSEAVIGRALKKYPRDRFFLADKMPGWDVKTLEDAERIFTGQLRKCGVEYFDFYLCHALGRKNFEVYEDFLLQFLMQKREQGLIRHLGFSFHDTPDALEYILNAYDGWDFVQLQINYLDWEKYDGRQIHRIARAHNMPIIIMEPVRGGALANLSEEASAILKAAAPEQSIASWAIRFAMGLDGVLTVLSGMSNLEQVQDNLASAQSFVPLTDAEHKVLDAALKKYLENVTVPCTGCRYCMDCPEGIDIPLNFTHYNDYAITKNMHSYRERLQKLDQQSGLNCISCGKCTVHCPQGIDIPEQFARIGRLLDQKQ